MIDKILKKRGKSRYWLAKQTGISYIGLMKIADNKTTSIRFDIIEKICKVLDCPIDELMKIEK